MNDDHLEAFLGATRRQLDAELAASTARPDLAASVARARELDPAAVSAAAVREVADLPPVAQLRPRSSAVRENMSDQTAIAPFVSALRDQIDADLARHIHRSAIAGASPADAPVLPLAAPRSRRTLVALGVALAAAVLLAIGLRGAFEARQAREGAIPGAAALASLRGAASSAEHRGPPRIVREQPVPEAIKPVPEAMLDEADPKDSKAADTAAREPRPRTRKPAQPPGETTTAPRKDNPGEDPLSVLDREAQARWRSGDLRGASEKFSEIVRRAPSTRAAETAYGDLFALEHQLGGDPVALWRAYLRQFPHGRYADDARAGVCRREPADTRAQCWTDYLATHPHGAHHREADQAIH